jgi:hypothetical protein
MPGAQGGGGVTCVVVSAASRVGVIGGAGGVGTLPKGYVRNIPLPRVPLLQGAPAHQVHAVPDYYDNPYGVPTYGIPRSIVERAAYAFSPAWHAVAINN